MKITVSQKGKGIMKKISENLHRDLEKAGKQVLVDEELDLINGGEGDYDDWCAFDYCCYAAWKQPDDTDKSDKCWSNYNCIVAQIAKCVFIVAIG